MSSEGIGQVEGFFDEPPSSFPVSEYDNLEAFGGKTLYKGSWWIAMVLVKTRYGPDWKYQIRLYKWEKQDGDWKQRQKYNISQADYVGDIVAALALFSETDDPLDILDEESIEEVERLNQKVIRLEEQLAISRERIEQERKKLREEKRAERRDRVSELEDEISDFRELVDSERKESEYQRFLLENEWFFGSEYYSAQREVPAGYEGRVDFFLEGRGAFHDVVELKLPSHKLFIDNPEGAISASLKNALSQIAEYLDFFGTHRLSHREQTGIDVYQPRGIIVIGRDDEDGEVQRRIRRHKTVIKGNIDIITYDTLIERAEQTLDTIRARAEE